jgi:DNA-directed RNA polymerase subunit N
MMFPVRCFSCGKPIGHLWEEYLERIKKGEDKKEILNSLGVERYCCRGIFLSHKDFIDEVGRFRRT